MSPAFANFLREIKLFIHLPLMAHLCIMRLMFFMLYGKGRPSIRRKF